jgi:hypothetical protein
VTGSTRGSNKREGLCPAEAASGVKERVDKPHQQTSLNDVKGHSTHRECFADQKQVTSVLFRTTTDVWGWVVVVVAVVQGNKYLGPYLRGQRGGGLPVRKEGHEKN